MYSRTSKLFTAAVLACTAAISMVSCDNDNQSYYLVNTGYNALVTVKTAEGGGSYLQLDDETTLNPVNVSGTLFDGKEVRALTNFNVVEGDAGGFSMNVRLNWIDSIRTKPTVPSLGDKNDETYGSDPIEIVNDWITVAEDGYLTLRFRTLSEGRGNVHYVNLLTGVDANDPYTVELRHDAKGDVTGYYADGIIAFNLDSLPDTGGQVKKLTLKWKGYEADKSVTFDFCTNGDDHDDGDATTSDLSAVEGRQVDVESLTMDVE